MRRLFTVEKAQTGKGPVLFAWQRQGNFLVVAGSNKRLLLYDRQGTLLHQAPLPGTGNVLQLEWEHSGEVVAIVQQNASAVSLFSVQGKKLDQFETAMKDITWVGWSITGSQLAIATARGSLLIYNRRTYKKSAILTKHTGKVTAGAWSGVGNILALGAEDKTISFSDERGDERDMVQSKGVVSTLCFAEPRGGPEAAGKTATKGAEVRPTLSAGLVKDATSTLLLYTGKEGDNPVELAFQAKYGMLVSHRWFGDGYMLIGFSSGWVVVISTHADEIGTEVASHRAHSSALVDIAYSPVLQKGASCGDNCIKVFDMSEMGRLAEAVARCERVELEGESGQLARLHWTDDGQILTASSKSGCVYAFLTRIPVVHAVWDTRLVYLTSLRELCVKDVVAQADVLRIAVEIEPSLVALGPSACAVGMNNQVYYYKFEDGVARLLHARTYPATVEDVRLASQYAAVLCGGRIVLHAITQSDDEFAPGTTTGRPQRIFPEGDASAGGGGVRSMRLTDEFLIYATSKSLHYFATEDWASVNEWRTDKGIRRMWPNACGTRVVIMDDKCDGWLYSPVTDALIPITNFSPATEAVIWDAADWGVFVACDTHSFVTFVHSTTSRWGAVAEAVCLAVPSSAGASPSGMLTGGAPAGAGDVPVLTPRPFGFSPVMLFMGHVVCQMPSGGMVNIRLRTHTHISEALEGRISNVTDLRAAFAATLALLRLADAWKIATQISAEDVWVSLGDKALQLLDIELAIRVYRQLSHPAMVTALEAIRLEFERPLLLGHVSVLFRDFAAAQNHFLHSSRPALALEMRRDLQHWEQALKLAESLAPDDVPHVAKEFAQQLEARGDYAAALDHYRRGCVTYDESARAARTVAAVRVEQLAQLATKCQGGIARCSIRLSDTRAGISAAATTGDPVVMAECATLLEEGKHYSDAAALLEKAQQWDRAALIYIQHLRQSSAAQRLLSKVTSPKVFAAFAALREREGALKEAEAAYEKAEDLANVVRLNLEKGGDPVKAYKVVRASRIADGAALAAKHARTSGDNATAVEFYLIARSGDEAFELAQQSDQMGTYTSCLGEGASPDEYRQVAEYYDSRGQPELAGDYYLKAAMFPTALQRYLSVGEGAVRKAINVVGKARSDPLTQQLVEFLMGGPGGGDAKDPAYIFQLYLALGSFEKAARTAVILARREQDDGNYRVAHRLLFDTTKDLEAHRMRVTQDIRRALMLLHSYTIAKVRAERGDTVGTARLLVRVAKNIPKFPKHVVPILVSTVLKCRTAGLHTAAFEYASVLARQDYFSQITNDEHKRRISQLVRKAPRSGGAAAGEAPEPEEEATPCPFCSAPVPEMTLECGACKQQIPYCIVTGKHMVLADWTQCPACHFPALYSEFMKLFERKKKGADADDKPEKVAEVECPMCEHAVAPLAIRRNPRPDPLLFAAGPAEADAAELGAAPPAAAAEGGAAKPAIAAPSK